MDFIRVIGVVSGIYVFVIRYENKIEVSFKEIRVYLGFMLSIFVQGDEIELLLLGLKYKKDS